MSKLMIRINDGENIIDREMNADEIAAHEQFINDQKTLSEELKERQQSRAELLERLGITADEAALLLG
jgi:hypothetical protein